MFVAQSLYYLETYLKVSKIEPMQGDYVFIFETQTHREFDGVNRKDTRKQIRPMGEQGVEGKKGRDGIRGPNGRDGRDGEQGKQGRPGIDGKDGRDGYSPSTEDVAEYMKLDPEFVKKIKGDEGKKGDSIQGEKGKDGKDAEIDYNILIDMLKKDREFIAMTKGDKGDRGFDGKTGKGGGQPGRDGIDGRDGKDGKIQMILLVKGLYEEIGNDGDYCMDIDSKRVYEKVDGVWVFRY